MAYMDIDDESRLSEADINAICVWQITTESIEADE